MSILGTATFSKIISQADKASYEEKAKLAKARSGEIMGLDGPIMSYPKWLSLKGFLQFPFGPMVYYISI